PEYIPTHVSCFSKDDIEMIVTGFEPYNFKPGNLSHKFQEIFFNFVRDVIYSNLIIKMIFMGNGVFFRRRTLNKVLPIDPTTLVDDFSIATELFKLGVKEYFSIYPWVEIQYANGLKELWKQHFRWYYGGFDEMLKRAKSGVWTFKAIYTFAFVFFFSPIILSSLSLMFGTYLFLVILGALVIYVYSTFTFSTLLDTERKVRVLSAFILPPFIMLFELSVLIPAIVLPLIGFKRKIEWYKVERDEA
ncbi:MAG: glycosyltransferase family 2 protein, partial [Thermotogaceae bacterium]|nr:glycosyltransferase family 2 protein [Thermotogaceae bacterium]